MSSWITIFRIIKNNKYLRQFLHLIINFCIHIIKATTNDLLPPWPNNNSTFSLQMPEDTILPIGAMEMQYFGKFYIKFKIFATFINEINLNETGVYAEKT